MPYKSPISSITTLDLIFYFKVFTSIYIEDTLGSNKIYNTIYA